MNGIRVKKSLGELQNKGLANVQTGPFGTVLKASEYSDHGVPVISVGEIKYGHLKISDNTPTISEKTKERLPQFVLKTGDIVFGRKGAIDRNAIISAEQTGWFLGSDGIRLRLSEEIDSVFVSYQLRSSAVGKWLLQNSSGSIMPSLNQKVLDRLPIWLPEVDEQKKIAAVLSALDAKIDCNNRINAELEAMAKTLYDYWFVQFDFPDANGKPYKSSGGKMVYNATLKREIPVGWRIDELGNISSLIRRGLSPSYVELGGIAVLNQKCIREHKISFLDARRHAIVLEAEDERLLHHFDVLINSTGVGTLGRVAFVKRLNEEKTTVDSHVTIVRANSKRIHLEYLAWTVLRFQTVIEAAANGSTGQVELNKAFLEELNIVVPDTALQKSFSAFVSPLVKVMAAKEKEVEHLTQLRDWLLPMLMNGQVTVA